MCCNFSVLVLFRGDSFNKRTLLYWKTKLSLFIVFHFGHKNAWVGICAGATICDAALIRFFLRFFVRATSLNSASNFLQAFSNKVYKSLLSEAIMFLHRPWLVTKVSQWEQPLLHVPSSHHYFVRSVNRTDLNVSGVLNHGKIIMKIAAKCGACSRQQTGSLEQCPKWCVVLLLKIELEVALTETLEPVLLAIHLVILGSILPHTLTLSDHRTSRLFWGRCRLRLCYRGN